MTTVTTDAEIDAEGGLTLRSPLPAWVTPGPVRLLLMVEDDVAAGTSPRPHPAATPEMLARRSELLGELRKLDPFRGIADPVEWQREMREDHLFPGRE